MRQFKRLDAPDYLVAVSKQWGQDWKNRRDNDPSAKFSWRVIGGEPLNQKILPELKAQTEAHCSFCDNFPVSPPSLDTVEHFRPKSKFPLEAYEWGNLYFCCDFCQQKRDDYEDNLLRPDGENYRFDDYFRWDFTTGELLVNDKAPADNQRKAEVTIRLYRLNDGHPTLRKTQAYRRAKFLNDPLDEWAYRHFLESTAPDRLPVKS